MNAKPLSRAALLSAAITRAVGGIALVGGVLFLPAGTLQFWQAWLYLVVLFAPVVIVGIVLIVKDPELMERRMRMRESRSAQKAAVAASALSLLGLFAVAGFDRRFAWSDVPTAIVLLADVAVVLGYLLFVLTIRENRFASRVIEVQDKQTVISTGPYAIVRHPMYLALTVIFVATPLALGSYWALIPALLLPLALALRIGNEEQLLRQSLGGYEQYCQKVKYRLIPLVW